MYRYFWILIAALVGETFLQELLFPGLPSSVDLAINLVFGVTVGKFGNYWYYLHLRRLWQTAQASGDAGPAALARKGGTRWWPVLVTVTVFLVLLYLAVSAEPA